MKNSHPTYIKVHDPKDDSKQCWDDLNNKICKKFGLQRGQYMIQEYDSTIEIEEEVIDVIICNKKKLRIVEFECIDFPDSFTSSSSNLNPSRSSPFSITPYSITASNGDFSENDPLNLEDDVDTMQTEEDKKLVLEVLNKTTKGKAILREYDRNHQKSVSSSSMKEAARIMMNHVLNNRSSSRNPINTSTKIQIARGLAAIFPAYSDPTAKPHSKDVYTFFFNIKKNGLSGCLECALKHCRKTKFPHKKDETERIESIEYDRPVSQAKRIKTESYQPSDEELSGLISMLNNTPLTLENKDALLDVFKLSFNHRETLRATTPMQIGVLYPKLKETSFFIEQEFALMYPAVHDRLIGFWEEIKSQVVEMANLKLPIRQHNDIKFFVSEYKTQNYDSNSYDYPEDVMIFLCLIRLVPCLGGATKSDKKRIPVTESFQRLIVFEKSGTSLKDILRKQKRKHPYIIAMGPSKAESNTYFVVIDQTPVFVPGGAAIAALDILFKSHFVYAIEYDPALFNFFYLIQKTVFAIGRKDNEFETTKVHEVHCFLLNQIMGLR